MADIRPFKGFRYNIQKISLMKAVTAPPYDVIPPKLQEELHFKNPNNVIRLILGKTFDIDDDNNNRYTRAAEYFNKWQQDEILFRDSKPAIYFSETDFFVPGAGTVTRRGMISLIRAQDYEDGVVLPHERTFSGTKQQRLQLIKHSQANFSSIFSVYPDHDLEVINTLDEAAKKTEPLCDFDDLDGNGQRLWAVTDPDVVFKVAQMMGTKRVYIADGHHRFETAQNYRRFMNDKYPHASKDAAFNFTMMYLCAMTCPGLVIFPAHRLMPRLDRFNLGDFLPRAEKYFYIDKFSQAGSFTRAKLAFLAALSKNGIDQAHSIGLVTSDASEFFLLTLRPGVMEELVKHGNGLEPPLWDLDTVILTRVILMEILGLTLDDLDDEELISYLSKSDKVIEDVCRKRARLAFLLNPARIDQVENIAEAGLILPRKTTYFYPKVLTGLVMNKIVPEEEVNL